MGGQGGSDHEKQKATATCQDHPSCAEFGKKREFTSTSTTNDTDCGYYIFLTDSRSIWDELMAIRDKHNEMRVAESAVSLNDCSVPNTKGDKERGKPP